MFTLIQQNYWSKELHHGSSQRRNFPPKDLTWLGYRLTTEYSWLVQMKLLNVKIFLFIQYVIVNRGCRWIFFFFFISWWSCRVWHWYRRVVFGRKLERRKKISCCQCCWHQQCKTILLVIIMNSQFEIWIWNILSK